MKRKPLRRFNVAKLLVPATAGGLADERRHADFGEQAFGLFVRESESALCGAKDDMPGVLSTEAPPDLCVICAALCNYPGLAGI